MALTPEQKAEAHERGLRQKAEREAKEAAQKPKAAQKSVGDYERFREVGLSHEEALAEIKKREKAREKAEGHWAKVEAAGLDGIHIGPRGGRYRINNNGRKSYDVP